MSDEPSDKGTAPEPMDETQPLLNKKSFRCPHCRIVAKHDWYDMKTTTPFSFNDENSGPDVPGTKTAHCQHCEQFSIWVNEWLVYPESTTAPMPHESMPEDVKTDYLEARRVFGVSHRAAGGLLRIAFEKLLPHVGATNDNMNQAIGELVSKGLKPHQKGMDVMRVFGSNAVHPGVVQLDDPKASVEFMFYLLNHLVESMIVHPKRVDDWYHRIPAKKREDIDKRDKPKQENN